MSPVTSASTCRTVSVTGKPPNELGHVPFQVPLTSTLGG